jgi:hypothetical protein
MTSPFFFFEPGFLATTKEYVRQTIGNCYLHNKRKQMIRNFSNYTRTHETISANRIPNRNHNKLRKTYRKLHFSLGVSAKQ